MKKILFIAAFLVPVLFGATAGVRIDTPATRKQEAERRAKRAAKAKRCFGRILVLDGLADFKVKVSSIPSQCDLRVRVVSVSSGVPGEWEFVDGLPDWTVEFVDVGEDFSVCFE